MIVLFFFEIIKVQIVKNGNLYNFFKKYQLPLQLSPLKRKIHPSLRPVAPKRKKKPLLLLLPPPLPQHTVFMVVKEMSETKS